MMAKREIIGLTLTILFWLQVSLLIYLGIRLYMVGRQLQAQKEPVKTPAMIRNKI